MTLWGRDSAPRDRIGDFLIAASLALFPLLPTGFTYLGQSRPWALEVFFLSIAATGIVLLAAYRREASASHVPNVSTERVKLVRIGYVTWLIPAFAAMLIGLMERTPLEWEILRVEAGGLLARLGRPMHQAGDTFYPLRVGLTYLEGGLAFWLLSAALTRTARPDRRMQWALNGCLLAIGLVSGIAIIQYFTRWNLHEYWVRANPGLTRSHATLDDPNTLASFLVLGIGLAGSAAWSPARSLPGFRPSTGPVIVLVLALGALVTTVSRAGLGGLLIAAVFVLVGWGLAERRGRIRPSGVLRWAVIATIVSGFVIGIALLLMPKQDSSALPTTPVEAVLNLVDPRRPLDPNVKARLNPWKAAIDFGTDEWPLGNGLGQFPRLYASYPNSDGPENAHNFFLQVFAEVGVLGLAGLGVLLVTIAAALSTGFRTSTTAQRAQTAWLTLGLLAFVLTWMTGHPLLNLSNQLWFASVLAVGLLGLKAH